MARHWREVFGVVSVDPTGKVVNDQTTNRMRPNTYTFKEVRVFDITDRKVWVEYVTDKIGGSAQFSTNRIAGAFKEAGLFNNIENVPITIDGNTYVISINFRGLIAMYEKATLFYAFDMPQLNKLLKKEIYDNKAKGLPMIYNHPEKEDAVWVNAKLSLYKKIYLQMQTYLTNYCSVNVPVVEVPPAPDNYMRDLTLNN